MGNICRNWWLLWVLCMSRNWVHLKGISWLQDSQTDGGRWYRFWGLWLMFENYLNKSDRGRGLLTELLTWVWLHAGKEMCLSRKNTANSPPPTHIHTPYMFEESLEKVLIYITDLHNTFTRSATDFV